MGKMKNLQEQVAALSSEPRSLGRAQKKPRDFAEMHSKASTPSPKNGDQGEEKKKNRGSGKKEVRDRMDIDKCDPVLKKLANDLLRKRGLAAEHVWAFWGEPEKAKGMGMAARIAHELHRDYLRAAYPFSRNFKLSGCFRL